MFHQMLLGEGIEERIDCLGDGVPCGPRPVQRRGIGRFLEVAPLIELGCHIRLALRPDEPEAALLTGEVADDPAQAVHRQQALDGILVRDALQTATEFTSREAQLID